ncbi:MAG TPA: LuxR C-terminal-related transcriptional regulator [Pseudonocardia sp.]|jgi:DNA-binding CsgD family transcriptional regulator|nr:LuxR C-terminal-related transcriptional regulator [Pseudonocardia sp.]
MTERDPAQQPLNPSAGLPDWACGLGRSDESDERAVALLERFRGVAPDGPSRAGDQTSEERIQALSEAFETQMRRVQDALQGWNDPSALAALEGALEAKALEQELTDRAVRRRLTALISLQGALGALRRADSVAAILKAAPRELTRACGFDRANLFKVENSCMVLESNYWHGDPEGAQEMLRFSRARPARLEHMLLETEMIRRHTACLVLDARNDPRVPRELADFARTRSYVAAPIMPSGTVIGFVHADCLYQGRNCDEIDRDLIWAFAEGFGYAFERTVLIERLRRQRDRTRDALAATLRSVEEFAEDELRLTHAEIGTVSSSHRAAGRLIGPEISGADLTRREGEVLDLMATGMTNQAIADQLVITTETVKAHVKHILRKLHAANRSEAVSRYIRSTPAR